MGCKTLSRNMQLQTAICSQTVSSMLPTEKNKQIVECTCYSDSAFCRITLVIGIHILAVTIMRTPERVERIE